MASLPEGAISVTQTLKTTSTDSWSAPQAAALFVICLLAGTAGGWLIRKSTATLPTRQAVIYPAPAQVTSAPAPTNFGSENGGPLAEQLKQASDSQVAPLLKKLQADPKNAGVLANIGNIYYDGKQYSKAIEYYEQALNVRPTDTSVRTDLGTAYWYTGDADTAISQFNKALAYDPNKADTLFNLGVVKWQGKKDGPGAVAAWQKLLATNPAYPNRDTVEQLIAQAQQK